MSTINPYQDIETRRQYRNHTNTQKKNISELKEAVVVNSMIKDNNESCPNIENMYDNLVIPDRTVKPDVFERIDLNNIKKKNKSSDRTLAPLLGVTVGIFGILAAATAALSMAATHKKVLPDWKTLPEIPKNVAINNEPHFVTYLMIRDPNMRNILGALGVFVLSAVGLAGKNFVDGVKEIWVRKKQADVQKDLQEKLIAVETQSFSGKMQILRNMLSEKARELDNILHKENIGNENTTFKKFISFKSTENAQDSKKKNILGYTAVGLTTVLITGLGFLAFRNVQKTARIYENYASGMESKIKELVDKQQQWDKACLDKVKNICVSMNFSSRKIENTLKDAKNLPEGFIEEVKREAEKVTQEGAEAIAGKPGTKPSLYSHTDDDRAHLYNMIVNWENPLLKILFAGLSTVTAVGYAGTSMIEAIKEAQVIKENAKTELDLQKRLVNVELNNFESKKLSVINPMMDEFKAQAMQGKDKNELKTRAENILYEIKNGPPFVYS